MQYHRCIFTLAINTIPEKLRLLDLLSSHLERLTDTAASLPSFPCAPEGGLLQRTMPTPTDPLEGPLEEVAITFPDSMYGIPILTYFPHADFPKVRAGE